VVDSIRLDTTLPAGGTLRATPGNASVALTWTAATDTSGVPAYKIMFAPNTAPTCTSGTAAYSGGALAFTHTGLTNGVVYAYRLCPVDGAGNVGAGITASARPAPEMTPPTGSVAINAGAAFVTRAAVTLTLSAADPSGVTGMCISNTATCTTWEAYATSKAWTLGSSNGPVTVYAWFKDKYENAMLTPVKATTTVDSTLPVDGTFTGTQGAVGSKQLNLSWTAATDVNGISGYKLVFAPGTAAPASCSTGVSIYSGAGQSFIHTGLTLGSSYSYRLCSVDKAGNVSAGQTRTLAAR